MKATTVNHNFGCSFGRDHLGVVLAVGFYQAKAVCMFGKPA